MYLQTLTLIKIHLSKGFCEPALTSHELQKVCRVPKGGHIGPRFQTCIQTMCIEAHHADLRQEGDVLQREVLGAALGPLGDLVEGLEQAPLAPRQDVELRVGLVVELVRLKGSSRSWVRTSSLGASAKK